MSIQEVTLSHNQKKKLLKAVKDETIMFEDDNKDIVLDVAAYLDFKANLDEDPVESILGKDALDMTMEYIIFT